MSSSERSVKGSRSEPSCVKPDSWLSVVFVEQEEGGGCSSSGAEVSVRRAESLIERHRSGTRSGRTTNFLCGDARALSHGFVVAVAVGDALALVAVAGVGDPAELEGRVRRDGVLVHDPPLAAALHVHVEVEVVPAPLDLLAVDHHLVLAQALLALPRPAVLAAPIRARTSICVHEEEGTGAVFDGKAVAAEELPGLRVGRRVVVDDEAGEQVRLAADAPEEVELDEKLVGGFEVHVRRDVVEDLRRRRHGALGWSGGRRRNPSERRRGGGEGEEEGSNRGERWSNGQGMRSNLFGGRELAVGGFARKPKLCPIRICISKV
ncbi:hypothetical protein EJB05_30181, partial [Eragrostis curvula]